MAPKEAALHTQDLVDVMVELDHWKSEPRFAKALKMTNCGTLYQLSEQDLEDHRGGIFGKEIWDSPVLSGKDDIPLTSLPAPAQTEHIMMLEIGGGNEYTFAPSHSTPDLDAYATKALLENILNPTYTNRGAIIHAACPALDHLRKDTSAWQGDGVLGLTNFQVSIAPACEFFDIKVYDNRHFTALFKWHTSRHRISSFRTELHRAKSTIRSPCRLDFWYNLGRSRPSARHRDCAEIRRDPGAPSILVLRRLLCRNVRECGV